MKIRYVLTTAFDQFTHHVGDTETLEEIILGLTDNQDLATRVTCIASHMQLGDGFAAPGLMLTCEEDK